MNALTPPPLTLTLKVGTVVKDVHRRDWVYLGLNVPGPRTKGSPKHCFHLAAAHNREVDQINWRWAAVKWGTIVHRFPALAYYQKPEGTP